MLISKLTGVRELASVLQITHMTVVLFTAIWSRDSVAARTALEQAVSTLPSVFENSAVAIYEVPLLIDDVHPSSQPHPAFFAYKPFWTTSAGLSESIVKNATRDLPWFPCLRLFLRSETGPEIHRALTYKDSFTVAAMRKFLLESVRDNFALSTSRQPLEFAGGEDLSRVRNHNPVTYPEMDDILFLDGVRNSARSPSSYAGPSGPRFCRSCLDFKSSFFSPVDVCSDLELSPDVFTSTLFGEASSENPRALVLFFSAAGLSTRTKYGGLCKLVHEAVQRHNYISTDSWIACIVDVGQFAEYAHRHGIDTAKPYPTLMLLDVTKDNTAVLSSLPNSADDLLTEMNIFAKAQPRAFRLGFDDWADSRADADADVDVDADADAVRGSLNPSDMTQIKPELVHVLTASSNVPVWLVVHQPWCGFSQRAVAVFRKFAETAGSLVRVFGVSDVDKLPKDVDQLVDGFPTVLRTNTSPSDGEPSACRGTGTSVHCSFSEYSGPIRLDDLLSTIPHGPVAVASP